MLRSLLNSARGRSAVAGPGLFVPSAPAAILQESHSATMDRRSAPPPPVSATSVRPERCCVYCGHPLYASPRTPRVRCPRCFQEMPLRDIRVDASLNDQEIITAGKIIIAPDARVSGRLVACRVDVAGEVLGEVLASQICRILAAGKIAGRLLCRHLELEPGARVEAQVELIRD